MNHLVQIGIFGSIGRFRAMDSRRLAYLNAMGVVTWQPRSVVAGPPQSAAEVVMRDVQRQRRVSESVSKFKT